MKNSRMWTTPEKIQKLVLDVQQKKISLGAAEGLMIRAEADLLLRCKDRASVVPFTLGPNSRDIASENKRICLYTHTATKPRLEMWEINEDWVGRLYEQEDPTHHVYMFFRKEMCLIPPLASDKTLSGVFKRVHLMRPKESYPVQVLGKAVSRLVKKLKANSHGVKPRVTIPTHPAVREESPFIGFEPGAGGNSITAEEANAMKLFLYPQKGEEMTLAFNDACWVFATQWTKWVYLF